MLEVIFAIILIKIVKFEVLYIFTMNTNIYIRLCVILTMYLRYCKASSYAETDASTSSKPSPFMYNKINTSNIKKPSKPQHNFKQFKSIKEEREKLYEAYNLLHRLAQVSNLNI